MTRSLGAKLDHLIVWFAKSRQMMSTFQDMQYALRSLRKTQAFTVASIATLAHLVQAELLDAANAAVRIGIQIR